MHIDAGTIQHREFLVKPRTKHGRVMSFARSRRELVEPGIRLEALGLWALYS